MNNRELTAYENDALMWIISKSDEWQIKFKVIPEFLEKTGEYLYSCTLTNLGDTGIGYGCDSNRRRAQLKSAVEALERKLIHENRWPHSSGVSLHPDPKLGEEKAIFEAIERDAFFSHFLTQTPFCEVVEETEICKVMRLRSHKDLHVVASIAHEKSSQNWIAVGLSCSKDLNDAIQHAKRESTCLYYYLEAWIPEVPFDLKAFSLKKEISVLDHGLLGKNSFYIQWFWNAFVAHPSSYKPSLDFIPPARKIPLPDWLGDCPLHLFRAEQERLQSPYWGHTPRPNLKRLGEFSPGLTYKEPPYPHCFS